MIGMDRVHPLKFPYPRGINNAENAIGMETPTCKRMSLESFIVRRTEHVGCATIESYHRNEFVNRLRRRHGDIHTLPITVRFLDVISEDRAVLVG